MSVSLWNTKEALARDTQTRLKSLKNIKRNVCFSIFFKSRTVNFTGSYRIKLECSVQTLGSVHLESVHLESFCHVHPFPSLVKVKPVISLSTERPKCEKRKIWNSETELVTLFV